MAPFAWSILPSVSSFLSPVTCPTASLLLPIALSTAPFTCSLSITHLYRDQMRVNEHKTRIMCQSVESNRPVLVQDSRGVRARRASAFGNGFTSLREVL